MTQPPAELTYGTIKWWVAGMVADTTADINDLPELRSVNGRAFVTPDVESDGLFLQELTTPLTLLKIEAELLIVEGRLQDKAGHDFAKLLANDSPGLSQTGWSYTLRFELDDGLTFGEFSFYLTTGEVLDLTMVVPLGTPSAGVVITKGEKGDAATITVGTVTTGAAGSAASVTNVGTSKDAILNVTIPQGVQGVQGPSGTITSVSATTLAPGAAATVTAGGTAQARTFAFGIPSGVQGPAGQIISTSVITLAAGSSATVTLGGTPEQRTIAFGIPRGLDGTGSVVTINGESPDGTGNVALSPADVGAAPTTHSHTSAQISDATSANVGDTVVRRDANGGVDFSQVWASGAQPPESHALTRRDYVDAAIVSRVPIPGVDPNADRLLFWDDSAGSWQYLTLGTGLSITGTTITGTATPPAASTTVSGIVELADTTETTTGTDAVRAVTPAGLKAVADTKMPHPGADPNADRIIFWDDSAGTFTYLTLGAGLSITGTTITAVAASETVAGIVELATQAEGLLAASTTLALTPDDLVNVPVIVRSAGAAPNRPATPRPVHWILPTASALPLTGTVAGGTAAAVDGLDIISRYS